jgi:ATP-dependent DNA helicase PIF1
MAGTGKTHVIKVIIKLFDELKRSTELFLSASTGMAAVLIGGHTIHVLTYLPKSTRKKLKVEELQSLWKGVKYLVIDEISMIPATLLADISHRLQIARYGTEQTVDESLPFGGYNIIFTGDLAQLKPVIYSAVFAHDLVQKVNVHTAQSCAGQNNLYGAYLWRQVNKVVKLKVNMRQNKDKDYANLLNRIRGDEKEVTSQQLEMDYQSLLSRQLGVIGAKHPEELRKFVDAPIIVTRKCLRDKLNIKLARLFAQRTNREFNFYYAKDFVGKNCIKPELQEQLWELSSSKSEDSLGKMPLVVGMKIIVTENMAISSKVVNGMHGTLVDIKYDEDDFGRRYPIMAYVHIPDSNLTLPDLPKNVAPIYPTRVSIKYKPPHSSIMFTVKRMQLPILLGFCITDYKAQGSSMDAAVIDLYSACSRQSVYVMLSRVKTFNGLAILRKFPKEKLTCRVSQELRNEFERLQYIVDKTTT